MSGWIGVQDKLPELKMEYHWLSSKPVLVATLTGDVLIATYEQIDADCQKCWYTYCSNRWMLGDVTHWMTLPVAP